MKELNLAPGRAVGLCLSKLKADVLDSLVAADSAEAQLRAVKAYVEQGLVSSEPLKKTNQEQKQKKQQQQQQKKKKKKNQKNEKIES